MADKTTIRMAALVVGGAALLAFGIRQTASQAPTAGTATGAGATSDRKAPASGKTAVVNVRLFDGERFIERSTVVFEPGSILAAGPDLPVPPDATVVDGKGRTLLPGLIDAHTHAYGDALQRALVFGVTTELDMFTDHEFAAQMRREQAGTGAPTRADLFSAGTLATAPGGHGTEYGMKIPTLSEPGEAQAFVDARLAEGSDWIKIVRDDGSSYGIHFPTLKPETIKALTAAAHNRSRLAVVHVGSYDDAIAALDAGADGLVHLFANRSPGDDFGRFTSSKHAFVIPTLSVLQSTTGVGSGSSLAERSPFASSLSASEKATLVASFPKREGSPQDLANALQAVRILKQAGVPLLAGSDAPNPGTAHGASLHREMELLVEAGLTPAEALAAATSTPARAFRLADRGRVAKGLRADLLLVEGDPSRDILATRSIVTVWKNGVPFDRDASRPPRPAEVDAGDGLVSDFEGDRPTSRFGGGWVVSTDGIRGGSSTATIDIAGDAAASGRGYLRIQGKIAEGFAYPWAGAAFWPGGAPMAAVNLSRFKELVFKARGDGGSVNVLAFAESLGPVPAIQTFTAGAEWKEIVIPFSAFKGMDGSDFQGLVFCAGVGRQSFWFGIDDVRLR